MKPQAAECKDYAPLSHTHIYIDSVTSMKPQAAECMDYAPLSYTHIYR